MVGPASETLARNYWAEINTLPFAAMLPLDTILVGSSRTRSASSLVTDSAAGATAFSCIIKTYNGAIGVNVDQVPCATIMEAAKSAGYMTGLVVTSRITHATPASFAAHVPVSILKTQNILGSRSRKRNRFASNRKYSTGTKRGLDVWRRFMPLPPKHDQNKLQSRFCGFIHHCD